MRKDFCLLAYTVCIGIALVAGGLVRCKTQVTSGIRGIIFKGAGI